MAVPQSTLLILAALGTLCGIGTLKDMDRAANILAPALSAAIWALFGIASFDVVIRDSYAASASGAIYPLAYLGLMLAVISGMLLVYRLATATGDEAGATEVSERRAR